MLTVLTMTSSALAITHDFWVMLFKNSYFSEVKADFYETIMSSNVCKRCRFVCVKFYLIRISFAAVIAKCLGAHFFGDTQCKMFRGSLFWDTL